MADQELTLEEREATIGGIGTARKRKEDARFIVGQGNYIDDLKLPGMLHGDFVRSSHAHALIKSIGTEAALKVDGVLAVLTAKDIPGKNFRFGSDTATHPGQPILVEDMIEFTGDALAVVGAESREALEAGIAAIKVEIEAREGVWTTRHGEKTAGERRVCDFEVTRGDAPAAFAAADVIIERTYETQLAEHAFIEPASGTSWLEEDGVLTIRVGTQLIEYYRAMAMMLGLPQSRVRHLGTYVGGGFGAKITTYLEPVAAVLSKKSGRPVQVVMSRKDVFEGTGPTSASTMRTKIGATKDGKITAAQVWMAFEAGAYPGSPVGGGTLCATGPYNIANLLVDGYDVVVNKQKVQAYRAPGQPQGAFAVEPVIDELAEKLGMDPLEFRLKNAVKEGDRMPNGVPHPHFGVMEMEEAMKAHDHYRTPLTGPNQGRGVAVGYRWQGGQASSATITVNNNGTINLVTGSVDIGGSRTAVAMQAAEILGISAEDVSPTVVDTDTIGWTGVTGGSRPAFDTGLAAIQAAQETIRLMKARAALLWEIDEEEVIFDGGIFRCTSTEDNISFKDLSARLMRTGGPVTCSVSAASPGSGPIIAGNLVDLEVDPETGKVDILRYTAFMDVGTAVHPAYVEGQIQGGTVQGIGWALNESYFYDEEGVMLNSSFLDYRMPTSLDVPMIDTVMIEVPNPKHPFGIRGVGEAPIIPPLPALAIAVSNAIGVKMSDLPLTPDVILAALESKGS